MLEILKSAETYDLVFVSIAIVLILMFGAFLINLAIQSGKDKKKVDKFVKDNLHKIEYLKYRIMMCSNLNKFYIIKRWADVVTENLRSEMVLISYDYGYDYGSSIIRDIKNLISSREECLIKESGLLESQ